MIIKDDLYKMFQRNSDGVLDLQLCKFVKEMLLPNIDTLPRLYRYSPANYHNIRGLETQTLYLTTIGAMNDIFEGLSCEIDDKLLNNLDHYSDIAYMKSFSEEKNNLLMWAHYAENYSGMCVEYDFSKLSEEILFHLFPVYYSNTRFTKKNLEYVISSICGLKLTQENGDAFDDAIWLKDIMYLFLTKSECWSYEKEWRIVGTYPQVTDDAENIQDDECPELYKITQKISVDNCIKAVYLGTKMKSDIKEHIAEICIDKLPDVKVYSTKLSKDKYELEFVPYT